MREDREVIKDFTSADIPDQSGKTIFITGANSGIGFENAKVFAERGARVLLGCRNPNKGQGALSTILKAQPGANVELVDLDLADLSSVRGAAEVINREPQLDVLLNNAGIMWTPKSLTVDGFESQFGVNHLGHFALTSLVLPLLEATPNSRVVTVSSTGHKMGGGDLRWDDIGGEQNYSPQGRYFDSKLANLLFAYELDRRLHAKGSTTISVAVHPGASATNLGNHLTGASGAAWKVFKPFTAKALNTAAEGAWSSQLAATAPGVEGGQYFGPSSLGEMKGPAQQVDSSNASKDRTKSQRLWDLSIEMTGIDPGI